MAITKAELAQKCPHCGRVVEPEEVVRTPEAVFGTYKCKHGRVDKGARAHSWIRRFAKSKLKEAR